MLTLAWTALQPASARAALPAVRAVQVETWWNTLTDQQLTRTFSEAAILNANTVRVPVFWSGLNPTKSSAFDQAYVARLDALFAQAEANGMRVLVTYLGTPCWASSYYTGTPQCANPYVTESSTHASAYPPRNIADWGTAVQWLLTRYGDDLAGLEVWNEPNLTSFWRGTPADYVRLTQRATQVRNSAHSSVPIVGGVVSGSDTAYLGRLYSAGLGPSSDAVSIHPYDLTWSMWGSQFGDPMVPRSWDPVGSYATGVPAVRNTMVANGDSAAKLWITEFGYATCPAVPACVSYQQQATYLNGALFMASNWSYLGAFTTFTLRDDPAAAYSTDFQYHFGVQESSWAPKPARAVVSDWYGT